jgi:hypothetical protein
MATKKHKNFEYAGHTGGVDGEGKNLHAFHCFDTPNGFAFAVVGADRDLGPDKSLAATVTERLQYYLEIEEEASPADAVRNALVYVNGYIHALAKKDPSLQSGELSCLCVLFRDQKVYYAWVGQVCLYLFTGKKLVPLTWEVSSAEEGASGGSGRPWDLAFLGKQQFLDPGLCKEALVPVDGDMLILGSSGFCLGPDEKHIRKVLTDSMPTHTKALRLTSKSGRDEDEAPMAVVLAGFYNMDQEARSFIAGNVPEAAAPDPGNGAKSLVWNLSNPLIKKILIGVGLVFLVYMLYDMFLFNPRPARRVTQVTEQELVLDGDSLMDTLGVAPADQVERLGDEPSVDAQAAAPAASDAQTAAAAAERSAGGPLPDDRAYTVRRGDTWGRIYQEFRVCSWFITNHPPNSGKFDRSGNPVAGSRLMIPVKYSASQRLNPNHYQEFTTDKVGNACQNANQDFLRRFEEGLRTR